MYQEPPESLEHQSDQKINPNLNAQWVNAKGMFLSLKKVRVVGILTKYLQAPG